MHDRVGGGGFSSPLALRAGIFMSPSASLVSSPLHTAVRVAGILRWWLFVPNFLLPKAPRHPPAPAPSSPFVPNQLADGTGRARVSHSLLPGRARPRSSGGLGEGVVSACGTDANCYHMLALHCSGLPPTQPAGHHPGGPPRPPELPRCSQTSRIQARRSGREGCGTFFKKEKAS